MTDKDPGAAWEGEALVSQRFGDVYASRAGALAQSRMVFLAGCGLPARWAGRQRFTVGELGFGTGLNMLALLDLWRQHRPAGATLHMMSVEGYPLPKAEVERALAAFPELADLAAQLLAQWPTQSAGWVRMDFPELGATLDLALMDVRAALGNWQGQADCWFLDGFAPAKNPDMWSAEVLGLVGARTRAGGRASTWSAAGFVRRGLAAAGFTVERLPGFSGKRERIEAVMPGEATDPAMPRVAIIGAGICGVSLARAFARLGLSADLFADGPMASGNPAALVSARLAAGSSAGAALHAQAFLRSTALIRSEAAASILAQGVTRHLKPNEIERAQATIDSGFFPPESLRLTTSGDTALEMCDALVVEPACLRAIWGGEPIRLSVAQPDKRADGWWLGAHGPFEAVVFAAGLANADLAKLPLRPVRGQVALADRPYADGAASWGGYVVPTRTGLLFGATHDRGDTGWDVRLCDTTRNLEMLAKRKPKLAAQLQDQPLGAVAGVRAACGDHQPVAGALGEAGLYVLGGMGGRGFALAPLLAEHVASLVCGVASPLGADAARLVDPMRF